MTKLFTNKERVMLVFEACNILFSKCWITLCLISIILTVTCTSATAQYIRPKVRFHLEDSPYRPYFNNLLSGFMQSATPQDTLNGFLQTPIVGDPLLVYVGEKDSTQFMAYASTYSLHEQVPNQYEAEFKRYGIRADIKQMPAYCTQIYTYPDTTASKGFLLDIDNASWGPTNEDMDVVFIDKQTIRAYKRSYVAESGIPDLFYVAHFSHPFHQWNIRREVVKLENGNKEKRCKVALFFNLKSNEKLTVQSYVSNISTNNALAQIKIKGLNISDKRKNFVANNNAQSLLAQAKPSVSSNLAKSNKVNTQSIAQNNSNTTKISSGNNSSKTYVVKSDIIEVSTRNAELKAAFSATLRQLKSKATKKNIINAIELIGFATKHYIKSVHTKQTTIENVDSLVLQYAKQLFNGTESNPSIEQTAWFFFNAMGIVPIKEGETICYKLVRPMFNVVTLHLPHERRFIIHCKRNTAQNRYIERANMLRQTPLEDLKISQGMLNRGGIMEIVMTKNCTLEDNQ